MQSTAKVVTLAELAEHNVKSDLWIAVHGKVYQLESFATDHPGGTDILLECAGSDATEPYDFAGHSIDAIQTLNRFLVGSLQGHVETVATHTHLAKLHTSKPSGVLHASPNIGWNLKQYTQSHWARILTTVLGFVILLYLVKVLKAIVLRLNFHEFGNQNTLAAFWSGLLLAMFLASIGASYVYTQFTKTLEHTKEPFAYPAIIPRKGFY